MKNIVILFLTGILFFSCNNNDQKEESEKTDSVTEEIKDTIKDAKKNDTVSYQKLKEPIKLKILTKIVEKDENLKKQFSNYTDLLNSDINSEEQIIKVLETRDKIISPLSSKTEDFYFSEAETDEKLWSETEKELLSVGFMPIYAEGMFVYLGKAPVLTEEINLYASEPFKLFIEFNNNYDKALGGEYPYMGLEIYFDAFETGYKLYKNYANSEYYKKVKETFSGTVTMFTDIHKYGNECFAGQLHTEYYPWAASCNIPELFVKRFPETDFTSVFEKLQNNMSEIEEGKEGGEIYLVTTSEVNAKNGEEESRKKLFDFQSKGIDIVHNIKTEKKNGETVYFLTYRFFSDKSKAEKSLNVIKTDFPESKIITVKITSAGTAKEV